MALLCPKRIRVLQSLGQDLTISSSLPQSKVYRLSLKSMLLLSTFQFSANIRAVEAALLALLLQIILLSGRKVAVFFATEMAFAIPPEVRGLSKSFIGKSHDDFAWRITKSVFIGIEVKDLKSFF